MITELRNISSIITNLAISSSKTPCKGIMKNFCDFSYTSNRKFHICDWRDQAKKIKTKNYLIFKAESLSIITNWPQILWINIKEIAHIIFGWNYKEILSLAEIFSSKLAFLPRQERRTLFPTVGVIDFSEIILNLLLK